MPRADRWHGESAEPEVGCQERLHQAARLHGSSTLQTRDRAPFRLTHQERDLLRVLSSAHRFSPYVPLASPSSWQARRLCLVLGRASYASQPDRCPPLHMGLFSPSLGCVHLILTSKTYVITHTPHCPSPSPSVPIPFRPTLSPPPGSLPDS